jgi:hypothetical protein
MCGGTEGAELRFHVNIDSPQGWQLALKRHWAYLRREPVIAYFAKTKALKAWEA